MKLQNIKGIGEKNIKYLNDANIFNAEELLTYYPYRYDIIFPDILEEKEDNMSISVNATVVDSGTISYIKKNFNVLRFKASCYGKIINVAIFNRFFLKKSLITGRDITLIGKYNAKLNTFTATNIIMSKLLDKKIIPVYHKINGITNKTLLKLINIVIDEPITDFTPIEYQKKYKLLNKKSAIKIIHNPQDENALIIAKRSLIYEELFIFMFKMNYLRTLKDKQLGIKKEIDDIKIENFLKSLAFKLTKDQKTSVLEGINDLKSSKKMNRLLLGDVGSGKTIVAATLLYANFIAQYQGVFLAPTEILATQHFYLLQNLFKEYSIRVEILIGSLSKKEKDNIIKKVNANEVDILVGTHAVLSDKIKFSNLGFIVTDEQHRFGVNQRSFLSQNKNPDMLFMSATPIPRTYALTIYGDMDTSIIKEKPAGRKDIITKIFKESELKEVLFKVLDEVKQNHQIYVVAPSISEDEENNLNDVYLLKEKFDLAFHHKIPIGILHGKLKKSEKESVMNNFKNGISKILISTTVIEVGVDVYKATTMIIFNAERFGLATLHQLRGRVGRNDFQSYCYLICNKDLERLKVLEESNDGFYISKKDFEFRGEGDLFGSRQSGDMNFKIGNLKRDYNILLAAKKDSAEFISNQNYLKHQEYCKIIKEIDFTN